MIKTVVCWMLLASFAMIGGMILATRWVITHPPGCDAQCKAQRDAQWRRMAN